FSHTGPCCQGNRRPPATPSGRCLAPETPASSAHHRVILDVEAGASLVPFVPGNRRLAHLMHGAEVILIHCPSPSADQEVLRSLSGVFSGAVPSSVLAATAATVSAGLVGKIQR